MTLFHNALPGYHRSNEPRTIEIDPELVEWCVIEVQDESGRAKF
jgi:hypothetical protein